MADHEKKALARWIGGRLARAYPDARCTLDFENPFQLFVATVLSAQCTDARVNQVTPGLFRRCPTPGDFLKLGRDGLEEAIRSTGFYRNKAKSILGACERIVVDFGGSLPETMESLLPLPGVGRKTANVILGSAFGKQEGIAVDTHVARVSRRLALSASADPLKIESELMLLFPRKGWTALSHRMILHGRLVCVARSPRCEACVLAERCAFAALGRQSRAERKKPARRRLSGAGRPRAAASRRGARR